jgi:NAD(P)-dependent dehydrogenase (short-subunit alcohol dehydrogenase family)
MRSVVVTGVSTGIGWGTARVLIRNGLHVFGSVRKQADADRLAQEFGSAFTPLLFDITDEPATQAAALLVRERLAGATLFGLVNNAGIATAGPLMHQPLAEFRHQIDVNLVGQLIAIRAFLPLLGTDRALKGQPGRIVNVSSVGGKVAAPFLGAYAASKHALEGLSESLRRELLLYGIDVIIVGPGAVATPIWDKAAQIDTSAYDRTEYGDILRRFSGYFVQEGRRGFPPERIGETILLALTTRSPRVRYAVVPHPFRNWIIPTALPRRLADTVLARSLGLIRRNRNLV